MSKGDLVYVVYGDPQPQLVMSNAVAAIICIPDTPQQEFLLQLRDDLPQIWYPGYWGCFGGAVDPGEKPMEALRRELWEELELEFSSAKPAMRLQFDMRQMGLDNCFRDYFVIEPTLGELAKTSIHEGVMAKGWAASSLGSLKLKPYDAFALHLYCAGKSSILSAQNQR